MTRLPTRVVSQVCTMPMAAAAATIAKVSKTSSVSRRMFGWPAAGKRALSKMARVMSGSAMVSPALMSTMHDGDGEIALVGNEERGDAAAQMGNDRRFGVERLLHFVVGGGAGERRAASAAHAKAHGAYSALNRSKQPGGDPQQLAFFRAEPLRAWSAPASCRAADWKSRTICSALSVRERRTWRPSVGSAVAASMPSSTSSPTVRAIDCGVMPSAAASSLRVAGPCTVEAHEDGHLGKASGSGGVLVAEAADEAEEGDAQLAGGVEGIGVGGGLDGDWFGHSVPGVARGVQQG